MTAGNPWDGLPDDLQVQMMLEMLVDDELAEGQRAKLLTSLDSMPAQWRTLALRFLERQVEHTSVQAFIAASGAGEAVRRGATGPTARRWGRWPAMRVAAGLVIGAGITTVVVLAISRSGQNNTNAAGTVAIEMPGNVIGSMNDKNVSVDVITAHDVPNTLLKAPLGNNGSWQVFIVPQGDKTAIIPVTTAKADIIY